MDIQEIIRQHGKSVAVVFKALGFDNPVNGSTVLNALVLYGGDFIDLVEAQVALDDPEYTGYGGSDEPTGDMAESKELEGVTVTGTRKSKKAKLDLTRILQTVAGGLGAFVAGKQAAKGGGAVAITSPAVVREEKKKERNYILIGAAVLIVLLAIAVLQKAKK